MRKGQEPLNPTTGGINQRT